MTNCGRVLGQNGHFSFHPIWYALLFLCVCVCVCVLFITDLGETHNEVVKDESRNLLSRNKESVPAPQSTITFSTKRIQEPGEIL